VLTAPIITEKISEKLPHNPTADIFVQQLKMMTAAYFAM